MQLRWTGLLVATFLAPLGAQAPGRIALERFTLPNGLEVVLAPDSTTQVVAVDLWIRAGSRYDPRGRPGLANLFSRLAFAGSGHVTRGEHEDLVSQAHGQFGADVEDEVLRLNEALPAEHLNLGLWLEAERLRGLRIDDSALALARTAELQDQAGNTDAFSESILAAVAALYDSSGCWPYAHHPRGSAADLNALTASEATQFSSTHFGTGNSRLVVAGGFEPGAARRLVTSYFSELPAGPSVPPPACQQTSVTPRQVSRTEPRTAVPAAGQFYRAPGHDHADTPALELLGILFGQGTAARLKQSLGAGSRAAVATQAGIFGTRRDAGAFALFGVASPTITADSLAALLAGEARWAASGGATQADLDRARSIYLATVVSNRQRPLDIAEAIQHAALFHGSPEAVNTDPNRYLAVTLADLQRVAGKYLIPSNAVTLLVTPPTAQ